MCEKTKKNWQVVLSSGNLNFAHNIWRTVAMRRGTLENGSAGIQFHEAQFRLKYYRPPCLCAYNPMTRHIKVAQ